VEESSDGESLRPGEVVDEEELTDEDLHDDEETGLTGKDRRRKRRKRRHNQLLDQRIARDDISPEEKKEADLNVVKRLLINGALIGLWYFFSLLISLVRTRRPVPRSPKRIYADHAPVQQMDVFTRQTQLSLSYVYYRRTFSRTVHHGVVDTISVPLITAEERPQVRHGPVQA
jgi:hypothetical protein